MKKIRKSSIILSLMFLFIFLMIPTSSLAENGEAVLTAVRFDDAVDKEVAVDSNKSATLTVPYGYGKTCDLSNGLELVYSSSVYSSASPSFPDGSGATVDGAAVTMVVSYQKVGDTTGTIYTSTYKIKVEEAAYTGPTFSGTITKSISLPNKLTFSASDFTDRYEANDGEDLSYIIIKGSNPSFGSLKLDGNTYQLGDTQISLSDINKGKLTFEATDSGTVSYTVTAFSANTEIGSVMLKITASAPTAADITYTTKEDTAVTFSVSDFSTACTNATGGTLSYVQFTLPSSSYGKLYYNYTSSSSYTSVVSAGTCYYSATSLYLSKVTFVPYSSYTGTVSINYTGYDKSGTLYTGTVKITVSSDSDAVTITYTTDEDEAVTFSVSDFNTVCKNATSYNLSYVKFTLPSSSYGKLYYNYTSSSSYDSKVSASTKYYRSSSPYLSKVTFVPYSGYSGTVTITYTGYNTNGDSYTGKVKITVEEDDSDADTITYTIDEDEAVTFSVSDFNTVCKNATSYNLSYVKFTLPSSSYGKLYYNYTSSSSYDSKVSASTKYYRSSSPYLSKVTFVPYSGYSGTVTITYTGYNTNGDSYTGTVKIKISENDSDADTITYTTDEDEKVTFSVSDFNEVCDDATDYNLSYVKFTLPSSSYGKLYYNYTSSSSYDSVVSSSTKYYRSSSPYLSKVTFVPYSGYSGTVTITYTGYNTNGDSYTGTVKIKISENDSDADTITYTTDEDEKVTFSVSDFNEVCDDATDYNLSYVKFTLPSSSYGKLYYNYTSSSSYDSVVSSSTKYYRSSSPYLSQVTFVPYSGYSGTVTITYTGYNTNGDSYTGKVKITVGDDDDTVADTISYQVSNTGTLAFLISDFNKACEDTTGETLSYVKFTLPSSSYGKLYYGYTSSSSYDSAVSASTKYYYKSTSPYLSKVTFVPYSSYTGTVTINYTGYNTDGDSYTGKISISVTSSSTSSTSVSDYFSDVTSKYSWAADAIDYLYEKSVVTGVSTGKFNPASNITRSDFMLMLYKAFNLSATTTSDNFSDVAKGTYYYDAVATAKALGIAKGSGTNFNPTGAITRQDVMVLAVRTLNISGHTLTNGSSSDLSGYSDADKISDYATSAVATLVKAKIVQGSSGNKVSPTANITRAEMAVLLYRILSAYGS